MKTNILGDHLCRVCQGGCTCCAPGACMACGECFYAGRIVEQWTLSSKDGETVLDGRSCVVDGSTLLQKVRDLTAENANLRAWIERHNPQEQK
jgi:hypothetical protein